TEEVSPTAETSNLEDMSYTELKKLAKEMGLPARGSRDELLARIRDNQGTSVDEAEEDEEDISEDAVPDEEEEDPVYASVLEAVEDMSNEDIADILADAGISAKGKREALIDKLVNAVKDGLIEFEDSDEDSDEEDAEEPATEEPVDEDEDNDDINNLDNPAMTEERKDAIIAEDKKIRKQFKSGKLTRKVAVKFLQEFYDTEDSLEDMTDEEVLDTYIDAVCRMIDDEGNLVEEGAYELNGEPACCGRHLTYSEDTGVYVCEHCGTEYEAE
ncbi:MAG: hypothetical protein IKZ94_09525, partial [Lachnospiraceae bacterium]|nr:hypothetical protein [Lachnospiraceae bacterium]